MKARRGKGFFDFFFAYLVFFLSHDHPRPSTPPIFSLFLRHSPSLPPSAATILKSNHSRFPSPPPPRNNCQRSRDEDSRPFTKMGWECEISIISRGAQFHVSAGRTYTLDLLAQTSSILYCALLVDSIPIPRPPLALSITAGGEGSIRRKGNDGLPPRSPLVGQIR